MEFIVAGAPRSANANARSRRRWRERVSRAARERLQEDAASLPADQDLAVLIIYFYQGETTLDVDNIAKSLLDGLKGVLFRDDRQVSELRVRKSRFSAGLSLTGASLYLLDAIERMSQTSSDFVYVRADPAPDHSRIP
ncbi:MAG: RusA family crossover junction endodeoxyribonuclease [Alphaproteobacteria bacterium]|nr:RusA family crossover junction endodeoxyribonuclease [Alphaproteobacteria bacterium]